MELIKRLYDFFNEYYYNDNCVPEYENLKLNFGFLEEDAPDGAEGKTDLKYSESKNNAEIIIKIKKELTAISVDTNLLHLSAVLLHEMVHAYLYAHYIYEFNEDKTECIHGQEFKNVALTHGLKDGYIIPADEVVNLLINANKEINRKGAKHGSSSNN